ncbi:DNA polymerase IV [Melittangium boletus]|uniref:DNA polymerase IV n=1 Tax=Melittangium boletus TaxID=83453 RepID=UPI003DA4478D
MTLAPTPPPRKVIHIDMDAFYASVEQRDHPALRGLPLAVGGSRERGVVAAASYEARRFGVRSAMSSATARRLCPALVFVPPRFDVYKAVSRQIRDIFARYTPLIEPLSLDEAYLDVTASPSGLTATAIAQAIRASIRQETGLTASAGVSYNKFLAKLASDQNKPDGLCVVTPRKGPAFVEALPVGRFHGVGPVTAARMHKLGIFTGADLRARDLAFLQEHFGKAGEYYHLAARGIDHRPVRADRPRKSVGSESTFPEDLVEHEALVAGLLPAADAVAGHCARQGLAGRTVTLKLRYADFRQVTRARTLPAPIADRETLLATGVELLAPLEPVTQGIRLLGLTLSNLTGDGDDPPDGQLGLEL